jgi:hypothetical protein
MKPTRATTKSRAKKDPGASYDRFKEFQGQKYTGMKVGRGHKWTYESGEWKEKKVTPDRWEFTYEVPKRRHGKAPEGSGAPVGTAYRWYILAEQIVVKRDANSYSTAMRGTKFKLSHKRADKENWAASQKAQAKRLVALLRELADDLEQNPEHLGVQSSEAAEPPTVH